MSGLEVRLKLLLSHEGEGERGNEEEDGAERKGEGKWRRGCVKEERKGRGRMKKTELRSQTRALLSWLGLRGLQKRSPSPWSFPPFCPPQPHAHILSFRSNCLLLSAELMASSPSASLPSCTRLSVCLSVSQREDGSLYFIAFPASSLMLGSHKCLLNK